MTAMTLLITSLALFYVLFILALFYGLSRLKSIDGPGPEPRISIVVAARNESANIAACLDSLLAQDYPPDKIRNPGRG